MALETPKEKLVYGIFVPIIGAILGAVIATWFQSATIDKAQLSSVVELLKDPDLNAAQKLQALELYKDITDRPWAIVRSLTTSFTMTVSLIVGAMMFGGYFNKKK